MHPVERLRKTRILPVVMIEDAEAAVPLARALLAGGIDLIEITLRTPAAWEAATRIAAEVPEICLGIGTILSPADMARAGAIGAAFGVSPGSTPALRAAARQFELAYLPAVATVSEAMVAREEGFRCLKFFPAETAGGVAALKGMQPLFSDLEFCPTGGIGPANAGSYLALPNVVGIGGSWVAPPKLIAVGDWAGITRLAAEAREAAR